MFSFVILLLNLNSDGWHIDSSDRIKNKKSTINSINKNDKCFQFAYKNFKKQFANTYIISNHDINKFILLLQKGKNDRYYWYKLHAHQKSVSLQRFWNKKFRWTPRVACSMWYINSSWCLPEYVS